jgi:hypothetical protein
VPLKLNARFTRIGGLVRRLLQWLDIRFVDFGPRDEIELLAFLTAPGRLQVDVGGSAASINAPAWITSFRVPLREGRPRFRLSRGRGTVIDFKSAFVISNHIRHQDLLYRGGSSSRPPLNPIGTK